MPFLTQISDAALRREALRGGEAAAKAVRLALAAGSAQERLDLLTRLGGAPSFEDWLCRRLMGGGCRDGAPEGG